MSHADLTEHFAFRPLRREDLPLLTRWLSAGHVVAWWGVSDDLEEKYFGNGHPVRRFIALLNQQPIGMIQSHRWSDSPHEAGVVAARPGEIGIDYLIGDEGMIGNGIGPKMIDAFLSQFASGRSDVTGVRVDIAESNQRSWRCLEKLGFRREQSGVLIDGQPGAHYIYVRAVEPTSPIIDPEMIERVVEIARTSEPATGMTSRVIAIDGPGGAGKSTLATHLADRLDGAPIIHTDDFASWDNQFDWYQRLIDQVFRPLADGKPALYQRYDWDKRELAEWHEIKPDNFLIIEGVSASRIAFRPYLAAAVWVETRLEERLRRGLERDGQDALPLWEQWIRGEDEYVAREHPDQTADIIVSGEYRRRP
jgi:uridine kinase/RimJ/RimL family protein N-acetyltransferase